MVWFLLLLVLSPSFGQNQPESADLLDYPGVSTMHISRKIEKPPADGSLFLWKLKLADKAQIHVEARVFENTASQVLDLVTCDWKDCVVIATSGLGGVLDFSYVSLHAGFLYVRFSALWPNTDASYPANLRAMISISPLVGIMEFPIGIVGVVFW